MHLAETREQARKEAESGILGSLVGYIESLTGKPLPYGSDPALAVEQWSTRGFPGFGIATVGTPDDAIETIGQLSERTGGFGCLLLLSHDCASWEAKKRSFTLFAEEVVPALRGSSRTALRQQGVDGRQLRRAARRHDRRDHRRGRALRRRASADQPSVDTWLPTQE